ncbi:MAG: GNAT family N-acetyltransferase [Gammaproteobacteria bacterium]|nr:GNAT family N-acetyltransferase [Gammaproteobacteria bacterium]
MTFRTCVQKTDPAGIEALVHETGFFSADEIAIARELADDGLCQGPASHYRFILADRDQELAGYACFGPVPCTRSSWDLYWIAVAAATQGQKLGQHLLQRVESAVLAAGGTRIYADTSSRERYVPTRRFYGRCGYLIAAEFPDFYASGDDKIVFLKVLEPSGPRTPDVEAATLRDSAQGRIHRYP